nr:DNA helicase [Tanacetum cinerariifolium]
MKGESRLDNYDVVPYNRALCLAFKAHINVEYCGWSMLIKYMFKYISKGPDRILMKISKPTGKASTSMKNRLKLLGSKITKQVLPVCEALGVLGDDKEWDITLEESAVSATSAEIRTLFAQILIYYDVEDPKKLWAKHWEAMRDDIPMKIS